MSKHNGHTTSTKNIFISYREKDTAGETGRLVDALKDHFYEEQIFMDIEKIEPGSDFTQAITTSLEVCSVMLAVIGPNWLGRIEGTDRYRIQEPSDWVRQEVSTALQQNIRVVPVLVDGGTLPAPEQLPPELVPLLRRQAYELSNKRWKYDTEQLIQFLVHSIGIPTKYHHPPATNTPGWVKKGMIALAFVIVLSGAVLYFLLKEKRGSEPALSQQGKEKNTNQSDNAGNHVEIRPDPDSITSSASETKETFNPASVTGTWLEEGSDNTTYRILQKGNNLTVTIYALGQQLSTGSGSLQGRKARMQVNLFGSNAVINAALSPDGKKLTGTYTFSITNDPQPMVLIRQ